MGVGAQVGIDTLKAMDVPTSQMLTVPELAGRMGIDPSTAWRYLRAGKLPGVQVGSRWLIDRDRVERFLAGKEDAQGRPLFEFESSPITKVSDPLPTPAFTDQKRALEWLRGLIATLEFVADGIENASMQGQPNQL